MGALGSMILAALYRALTLAKGPGERVLVRESDRDGVGCLWARGPLHPFSHILVATT